LSILPTSNGIAGLAALLPNQTQDAGPLTGLIDSALGLARAAVDRGADSVSISAQALSLSIQSGNSTISVRMTQVHFAAHFGAGAPEGLGLLTRGDIKDLLDAAYTFAGVPPLAEGAEITAPPQAVLDYWSVENTAGRIADFALSNYRNWLDGREDGVEARQEYVDYISRAVQQGFDEAMGFLEGISPIIDENVARMHEIVWDRFEDFVANGDGRSNEELEGALAEGRRFLNFIYNLPVNRGAFPEGAPRDGVNALA